MFSALNPPPPTPRKILLVRITPKITQFLMCLIKHTVIVQQNALAFALFFLKQMKTTLK